MFVVFRWSVPAIFVCMYEVGYVHMCVYGCAAVTGEGQTGYSGSSCYDCQLGIITEVYIRNPTVLANASTPPSPLTPPHAHRCSHPWETWKTIFQAGNLYPTWRAPKPAVVQLLCHRCHHLVAILWCLHSHYVSQQNKEKVVFQLG